VLDPFAGSGTTGVVALRHGHNFVGVELSPIFAELAEQRLRAAVAQDLTDWQQSSLFDAPPAAREGP
jgi:16S rRNA G966 N2-methylase RsmD